MPGEPRTSSSDIDTQKPCSVSRVSRLCPGYSLTDDPTRLDVYVQLIAPHPDDLILNHRHWVASHDGQDDGPSNEHSPSSPGYNARPSNGPRPTSRRRAYCWTDPKRRNGTISASWRFCARCTPSQSSGRDDVWDATRGWDDRSRWAYSECSCPVTF